MFWQIIEPDEGGPREPESWLVGHSTGGLDSGLVSEWGPSCGTEPYPGGSERTLPTVRIAWCEKNPTSLVLEVL